MINELIKQVHEVNVKNGFYTEEKNIGEALALIHSEVSEALEADRKDKYVKKGIVEVDHVNNIISNEQFKNVFELSVKDTFEDELADIMIRVMDLAYLKKVDLERHIKAKIRYNSLRGYKHGKKY